MAPTRASNQSSKLQQQQGEEEDVKFNEVNCEEEEEAEEEEDPHHSSLSSPALRNSSLRMSYAIARGEQGVLTFEPYKSILLPLWRFRTHEIAKQSCAELRSAFASYVVRGDFVGADMARKFIQMGMTRAKRYANHAGGRKYGKSVDGTRVEIAESSTHQGRGEKIAASEVFKSGWRECIVDPEYRRLKREWQREKRAWERSRPRPT